MKRKLGPLQLWQWILIGAAVGVGTVLYRRGHPAGAAAQDIAASATPAGAQYNPIDPTTGLPVSGGISGSPSGQTTGPNGSDDVTTAPAATGGDFTDLLTNFGSLETLLAGLSQIQGTPPPGDAVETDPGTVKTQTGAKRAAKKKPKKPTVKAKKTTHRKTVPGHRVTHHGGGKKTPSSSAPHNPRQHHNVQPPAHQRHEPTKHPSARHPAGARTPTDGPTPLPPRKPPRRSPAAVRTPLPRRRAPKRRR